MNIYDNYTHFDANLWSEAPEVDIAVADLKEKILAIGNISRWHPRYDDNLKLNLLNLYRATLLGNDKYVAYSRSKEYYQTLGRYRGRVMRYDAMVKIVDALSKGLGLVETKIGIFFPKQGRRRTSRMKVTEDFAKVMQVEYGFSEFSLSRCDDEELILLRDKVDGQKVLVDYVDTPKTVTMRRNLGKINALLGQHHIGLCLAEPTREQALGPTSCSSAGHFSGQQQLETDPDLQGEMLLSSPPELTHGEVLTATDFTRTTLRRIFNNGKFTQGGRFYHGWWQDIPSKHRQSIRINDLPVAEIDFSGLHFNLIYLRFDLPLPAEDVYSIPGLSPKARPYLKKALNIALNSTDEDSALAAIDKYCRDEKAAVPELAG